MPNTVRNLSRVSDLGVVGEWWVAGRRTHKGKGTHVKTPTTPFILMLEYRTSSLRIVPVKARTLVESLRVPCFLLLVSYYCFSVTTRTEDTGGSKGAKRRESRPGG